MTLTTFNLSPRRTLTREEWHDAYRAARRCRYGAVVHGPVNMLAKRYAESLVNTSLSKARSA